MLFDKMFGESSSFYGVCIKMLLYLDLLLFFRTYKSSGRNTILYIAICKKVKNETFGIRSLEYVLLRL